MNRQLCKPRLTLITLSFILLYRLTAWIVIEVLVMRYPNRVAFISLIALLLYIAIISCTTLSPATPSSPTPTSTTTIPPTTPSTPQPAVSTATSPPASPTLTESPPPPADATPTSQALIPPPPSAAGSCANTFYPLVPGYQWVYQITTEDGTSQIGISVTDVNENQAVVNTLHLESGVTTEMNVDCDEGAIINFPLVILAFLLGDVDGEINLDHVDGVFVPNYQTFADKDWDLNWESMYNASGYLEANIEGDIIVGRLNESPLLMKWQTTGVGEQIFQEIEVPAGKFPKSIKIIREIDLDFTVELEEDGVKQSLAATLILFNNLWYEPNIGLLRLEIDKANARIAGITFPFVIESTVELLEFRTNE